MTGPVGAPNLIDPASRPLDEPVLVEHGYVVHRAVPYAVRPGFRPLLLDLHRPQDPGRLVPLILFLHGGGWRLGDRTVFCPTWSDWPRQPFGRLVDAGFAVASVDYRLTGEAIHPAQLDDVTATLRWLDARAGADDAHSREAALIGATPTAAPD